MKAHIGSDVGSYTFDKTAKTVTFSGVTISSLDQILMVINATAGQVIFNPLAGSGYSGSLSGSVLTLNYDTSAMANTDKLLIIVDVPPSVMVEPPFALPVGATYVGNVFTYAVPTTPTDMIVLGGSSSKTIRLLRMVLHVTITTAALTEFFLVRRSTANTGGTLATANRTIGAIDSNNAAAAATLQYYTANPTSTGTLAATLKRSKIVVPTPTTIYTNDDGAMLAWDFAARDTPLAQLPAIRGTGESLALNFNGVALPTGFALQFAELVWRED